MPQAGPFPFKVFNRDGSEPDLTAIAKENWCRFQTLVGSPVDANIVEFFIPESGKLTVALYLSNYSDMRIIECPKDRFIVEFITSKS